MADHTRRRFVQVAGSTAVLGLAGCAGGDGESMDGGAMAGDGMDNGSMNDEAANDSMGDGGMDEDAMGDESMEDGSMGDDSMNGPTDPADAPRASIDRFSEEAGTLMVRNENDALPGPDEPIDFDQGPFVTRGLGPAGDTVRYYNFDVQPTDPAPIYALFREGEETPVEDQLNVVGVIPGDDGYNDFWHVHRVTVPEDYQANTVTSVQGITDAGYDVQATQTIKNCPIVPVGSTASMRGGDADTGLVQGWYDGQVVSYFLFEEAPLSATGDGLVPTSPIYVTFNTNPGMDGGGPASGFVTEETSQQTHNVLTTVPSDAGYSPLWSVTVYDNADFDMVSDLDSASDAEILATGTATVNCPVVSTGGT